MKHNKFTSLFLALALALSSLTGCQTTSSDSTSQPVTSSTLTSEESSNAKTQPSIEENSNAEKQPSTEENSNAETQLSTEADENEAAAYQLMSDLTGTYQELWPVILADEYKQTWISNCAALVGDENAEGAYEKLASMVTAEIYGEEAVEAYQDDDGVYFCGFTQELSALEVDGDTSTIKGYDDSGNELFSHTYHYIGLEEVRGLYGFESDDADSGEFTYFYIAPDTSDTTYHIEFRYGSDANALSQYDSGNYAYWLASGIATDYDQTMVENSIELFCTENLSE